eukprot:11175371-Lingulodinium_polyedra.AAC.1
MIAARVGHARSTLARRTLGARTEHVGACFRHAQSTRGACSEHARGTRRAHVLGARTEHAWSMI